MSSPTASQFSAEKRHEKTSGGANSSRYQAAAADSYSSIIDLQGFAGNQAVNSAATSNMSTPVRGAPNANLTQELMRHLDHDFSLAKSDPVEAIGKCVQPDLLSQTDDPILTASLTEAALLGDYKASARQVLLFRIDAMVHWVDIVVRRQITTQEGGQKSKAAETLQQAAKHANGLGKTASESKQILEEYDILIKDLLPHKLPEPEEWRTTKSDVRSIKANFTRKALDKRGFKDIPDIAQLLDALDHPPEITEAEITKNLLSARADWKHVSEIPTENPDERELVRHHLELERHRRVDPAVQGVMDYSSPAPAHNWAALRLVLERLRNEAATRFGRDQAQLNQYLDQYPLLRMYASSSALLLNNSVFGREYRDIIDPSAIQPETLHQKLDELIANLKKIYQKVDTDDDFLFDTAMKPNLAPLIGLYTRIEPIYGTWIEDEFENNHRWQESMDTLLVSSAMLALATPLVAGGIALLVAQTFRSFRRAGDLEAAAQAGIADLDEAALAKFQAYLDTAMLAATVAPIALRALQPLVAKALSEIRFARKLIAVMHGLNEGIPITRGTGGGSPPISVQRGYSIPRTQQIQSGSRVLSADLPPNPVKASKVAKTPNLPEGPKVSEGPNPSTTVLSPQPAVNLELAGEATIALDTSGEWQKNQPEQIFGLIPEEHLMVETAAVEAADSETSFTQQNELTPQVMEARRQQQVPESGREVGSPGTSQHGESETRSGMNLRLYDASEVALGLRTSYSPEYGGYLRWVEFEVPEVTGNFGTRPEKFRQNELINAIGVEHPAHEDLTRTQSERGHAAAQQLSAGDPDVAAALMVTTNMWPMSGRGPTGVNQGAYKNFESAYIALKTNNPGSSVHIRVEAIVGKPPRFVQGPHGNPVLSPDAFNITVTFTPPPGGNPPMVVNFVLPN